ncbi:hypothetical protein ACM26V_13485 [Salipaludibacillus sp. HK11]|uniref:hypothetical protein n=1 Tax=Salipaludibacillus sp. HK11 TaxID=3394320 RepID=UPI0039FD8ADF
MKNIPDFLYTEVKLKEKKGATHMSDEQKEFLMEQLEWIKEQRKIYDTIEVKLYQMKEIAEEATNENMSVRERRHLQEQIDELKNDVDILFKKLHKILH